MPKFCYLQGHFRIKTRNPEISNLFLRVFLLAVVHQRYLIALVVALGQLIGQFFAIADGFRRCQASVVSP